MSNVDVPHDKDAGDDDPFAGLSDIERLLAEEGVDLGSVEEHRPAGAEGMSARDWMIATSDDEMIRKRIGEEPILDAPAWLTSESDEADDPFAGMSDIERLLAEEGIDLSSVDEERPAGAEGMSARDWMITTSDDEMIRKRIGANELIPEENLPDTSLDDSLPDWLRDVEDEPVLIPTSATGDNDLPDWLQEIDEPVQVEPVEVATMTDEIEVGEDLPDWLRDDEEPESVTTAEVTPITPDDQMVVDDDLPDWLRDEEESVEAVGGVEVGAPDWLSQEPEIPAVLTAENEADKMVIEEALPDWLRDAQAEDLELQLDVAVPADDDKLVVKDALPEWLREVEEEAEETVLRGELPAAEGYPDWLKDEQEDIAEPLFDDVSESVEIDEEGLPDWLADVQLDDEPFEPSEPSPLDIDEMSEEGLPDWLLDVQQESIAADLTVDVVASGAADIVDITEEDELPAWLKEEAEAELLEFDQGPVATPEIIEPERTEAIQPEPEPEIPAASVVAEPEPAPVPVTQPAPPRPSGMPDWLKKLREGGSEVIDSAAVMAPVSATLAPPKRAARVQILTPEPDSLEEPTFDDLPDDPAERLKLAQAYRDQGEVDSAVRVYESLVSGGLHLDTLINDLQQVIKVHPVGFKVYQVLGDALMKDGRLQSALETYRTALEKLAS